MFRATDGLRLQAINTGRNYDEFVCHGGVWRRKKRFIQTRPFADMSHHLSADTTPFT